MRHPFIPQSLIGRKADLEQLCKILLEDGDVLMAGVPGSGRRTLLRTAAQQANARILEIDCLRVTQPHQFLQILANAITTAFPACSERERIGQWSLEKAVTIEGLASASERVVWHLPTTKEWNLFEELLLLPQQMAEWFDCRVLLVFENFPHIRSWDRKGKWEAYLRQEIQAHTRVSYALIATMPEPWVYASHLHIVALAPLTPSELEPWIIGAMAMEGLKFDPQTPALTLFLNYVQGHLRDAIALARRIWLDYQALHPNGQPGLLQEHHIHHSMMALVEDYAVIFESLLLLLPPSQIRVLESLALDPTDSPHSRAYIKKHQLSRGGGLQGALNSLEQKGLVYGPKFSYRIALPFLDFWLKQRLN